MLTVEKLNAFGANTAEGIARCINNEAFYLRMVDMAMSDANFGKLEYCILAIEECGITADDIWFPSMSIRQTRPVIIFNTFNQ